MEQTSQAPQSARSEVPLTVNQRVYRPPDVKQLGTVRYIGPLRGTTDDKAGETWVGVEWDDNTRGKHNGTVNGEKYFECDDGCGSMVPLGKLRWTGVSFLEALDEKYKPVADQFDAADLYVVDAKTLHQKKFELVGMEKIENKQKQYDKLVEVALSSFLISRVDPNVATATPSIVELDVSHNLLSTWLEIASLTVQLPLLKVLDLNSSRFAALDAPLSGSLAAAGLSAAFRHVKVLVLNACGLRDWRQVSLLDAAFPALEELHLGRNRLTSFPDDFEGFGSLLVLNLESNHIDDWSQVLHLSKLRSLQKLTLNDNKINGITLPSPDAQFTSLRMLAIIGNEIADWPSIDALDRFQSLDWLRFSPNPLVKELSSTLARTFFIGRIAKLASFNGSAIREKDRQEAEKYYMKYSVRHYPLPPNSAPGQVTELPAEFYEAHPRYKALVEKYGAPTAEIREAQSLQEEFVHVSLRCPLVPIAPSKKVLPASTTVSNLKVMCKRLFQLDADDQTLWFLASKDDPVPELMDDDTRTLAYHGVKDSTEIICEKKFVPKATFKKQY